MSVNEMLFLLLIIVVGAFAFVYLNNKYSTNTTDATEESLPEDNLPEDNLESKEPLDISEPIYELVRLFHKNLKDFVISRGEGSYWDTWYSKKIHLLSHRYSDIVFEYRDIYCSSLGRKDELVCYNFTLTGDEEEYILSECKQHLSERRDKLRIKKEERKKVLDTRNRRDIIKQLENLNKT